MFNEIIDGDEKYIDNQLTLKAYNYAERRSGQLDVNSQNEINDC